MVRTVGPMGGVSDGIERGRECETTGRVGTRTVARDSPNISSYK